MKLQLLYSLTFLLLAFVPSHAAISPEVYWQVKLPNTQMPKVIKDFIPHGDEIYTEKKVYYGLHQHGAWVFHDATEEEIRELLPINNGSSSKNVDNIKKNNGFLYKPYFFEEDLVKGKTINFPSLINKNEAPFWPRQLAESVPFSSKKIPEILNYFSIDSNSKDAQTIEETIKVCEEPAKKGEKRKCATSLESMVDFTLSWFKTSNVKTVTTKVQGENQIVQKYTIEQVQQVPYGDDIIICHKLSYTFAMHFCHVGGRTKTFMVSMVGADGTKTKAVSVCHQDTSLWNKKGLPFVVLNVKPGTRPICHFLQDDQIVFAPSR